MRSGKCRDAWPVLVLSSTSAPPPQLLHHLFGMASTRISAPMRGVTNQLGRLAIRRDTLLVSVPLQFFNLANKYKAQTTSCARSISTSTSTQATVSPIPISATDYVPVKPLEERTVIATIHQFPSLEPLRFETYPANRLYLPTRKDILHRAVIYEGDKTRFGNANTKTRYEVRGSARKIRPQKGSGRARLGDKKSPMLVGGGVAFGPKPRDFSTKLQKKVYDLAWRTALSYRFRKGELIIVDNVMEIESPSTRLLKDIFKHQEKLQGPGRSLLVTLEEPPLLKQALAELDRAEETATWKEVDVKDLLSFSRIIIERDALHNILLSHKEDLEHQELKPWDKNLVRSSSPTELEARIGWAEFRDLQLYKAKLKEKPKPKQQPEEEDDKLEPLESALSTAYESVASKRYAYAETLSDTNPERLAHTISSYRLLVEAKELQFKQHTGMSLGECFTTPAPTTEDPNPLPARIEEAETSFPRVQALEYRYRKLQDEAADVADISPVKSDELDIQAATLQVEILELQHKAAELASLTLTYRAEAERLEGRGEEAENSTLLAAEQEEMMAGLEVSVLEQKLAREKLREKVAEAKGRWNEKVKAQGEVERLEAEMEAKRAEPQEDGVGAEEEMEVAEEEIADPRMIAEPPVAEELRQEKKL
jgi:large subunit ribosomal protein L4